MEANLAALKFKGKALINGAVLEWARHESGFSLEELAVRMKVWEEDILDWEAGEDYPTHAQLKALANSLSRPSAVFYLPEPPLQAGIPASLRQAPGLAGHRLGPQELKQIRRARRMQKVASWALKDGGAEPVKLGPVDEGSDPFAVGGRERRTSGVAMSRQLDWQDDYEAFREWRAALEDQGVLVFQLKMGREGIRGFSLWDDYAPAAAVNTAYHPTARIFTLLHGVGHLLTRSDAACLLFPAPGDADHGVEQWCEQFAASYLVPEEDLRSEAARLGVRKGRKLDRSVAERLAGRFSVSARAVAIQLEQTGLAEAGLYQSVNAGDMNLWNLVPGGKGPTRPELRIIEFGPRSSKALRSAADRKRLSAHALIDYLQMNMREVVAWRRILDGA